MSAAKAVTATFVPATVALTITQSGTGTGTITSSPAGINCGATCSASFNLNSSITLTAAANAGSTFTGWTGACTGTTSSCTVTMSQAQTVSASFSLQTTLHVTVTGSGTGTVTSSPVGISCGQTCSFGFTANSVVTLTASPATGSTFQGWLGACSGTITPCTVTLNQTQNLFAEFSAPAVSTYQYDPNGNLTQVTDPVGNKRQIIYDSLDQAIQQLEPHPTVIGSTQGQIDTVYDPLGHITQITDPRNLSTQYQVDNLGNVLSQTSPDTGLTQNTYDDAGNLLTRTDARGKLSSYSYDSQNRLTQVVYEDQTITYGWDNCTNGIGRLCNLSNAGNSLSFSYDSHGRITSKTQTTGTVTLNSGYHYNSAGQLDQTTTPSGQTIGTVWLNDRLQSLTFNGQPLMTQITYEPDDQIKSWTWSNGSTSERFYDLAGRPVAISLGVDGQSLLPSLRNYRYDAASRITGIIDDIDPNLDQTYHYDGLGRLISQQKGHFTPSQFDYAYDLSGNRTSKILNSSTTETLNIDPGSNQLQQKISTQTVNYSYDASGNLTSDGTITFSYNAQGRRISATATNLNATYVYNALGQRISKTVNGTTTNFAYDGQGQLAGEYTATGQLIQETVWLGNIPIAVLKPNATQSTLVDSFYIHSDHLATPRKITRPSDNKVLWTWESEAFGNNLPNQNPSSLGDFVFNLRFPGQYYDPETGLHYNMARYYNPAVGGYDQSDPIGLAGGINTYTYVGGNPVNAIDPLGLKPGDPYTSPNAAAMDAINWVYGSGWTNGPGPYQGDPREWAGSVYQGQAQGQDPSKFYATVPNSSGADITTSRPSYPPNGPQSAAAFYHTHGQCTTTSTEDDFSRGIPSDVFQADFRGVPSFLGTPGGFIKRYDPDPNLSGKGPVTTLQTGTCCPGPTH
jgi:RHS repeat-associated protein/uncharacterized repeat protein (TIGR02543 family)